MKIGRVYLGAWGQTGAGEQAPGAKSGFQLPYCRRMGLSSSPGEGQLEFPAGRRGSPHPASAFEHRDSGNQPSGDSPGCKGWGLEGWGLREGWGVSKQALRSFSIDKVGGERERPQGERRGCVRPALR